MVWQLFLIAKGVRDHDIRVKQFVFPNAEILTSLEIDKFWSTFYKEPRVNFGVPRNMLGDRGCQSFLK